MSRVSAQLVAFAATAGKRRSTGLPVRTQSRRLHGVLDSLASICVRKGKGEVYAIAIQSHENDSEPDYAGTLTFTIAGNYGVQREVISHLQSVLDQLHIIADRCHRFQNEGEKPYPGLSPHTSRAIIDSQHLKESIYRHSLEKFTSRINKRYGPFMAFMARLGKYMARLGKYMAKGALEEEQKTWETLRHAQEIVKNITNFLPTKFKYDEMVNWLDMLYCDVREVLGKTAGKTAVSNAVEGKHPWVVGVNLSSNGETHTGADGTVFPLERYLQKVVAIHSHCRVLIEFAQSPRLRRFTKKSFQIRTVPSMMKTIPSPSGLAELIADTLNGHDLEIAVRVRLDRFVSATQRIYFQNDDPARAPVHCECALVQHFKKNRGQSTPPMHYLGVSKLSCNACAKFIEASNKHSNQTFYTRGCRGKWYFPWALPQSVTRNVSATFRDSMIRCIADILVQTGVASPRGLSAYASADRERKRGGQY